MIAVAYLVDISVLRFELHLETSHCWIVVVAVEAAAAAEEDVAVVDNFVEEDFELPMHREKQFDWFLVLMYFPIII